MLLSFILAIFIKKENWSLKVVIKAILKGFIFGLFLWVLLITFNSIFQLKLFDTLLYSFKIFGTGLEPSGSIIQINDITQSIHFNKFNISK